MITDDVMAQMDANDDGVINLGDNITQEDLDNWN
jgi:hypothetical protein